jgi:hypothetical protein
MASGKLSNIFQFQSAGMFSEDPSLVNFDRTQTQPPAVLNVSALRPPTLMMMTPNSLMNQSTTALPESQSQKAIDLYTQECEQQARLLSFIQHRKSAALMESERVESLMMRADVYFARERHLLIRSLRFHDDQILEKEQHIKDLLRETACTEMQRNIMSDELEESILRTIEVINISDLRIERENLERETIELEKKQQECDRIETEL